MSEKKFYVYFLRRPDKDDPFEPGRGQPFYVGKGCDGRSDEHRREALRHRKGKESVNPYKNSIINYLWKSNLNYEVDIIFNQLTEFEAFEIEAMGIASYGRHNKGTGILANMTNGGDGASGLVHTEETKKQMSNIHKGMMHTEEECQKISRANKGKIRSKEWCLRISQAKLGKTFSEEIKKRLSEAQKIRHQEKPFSAEVREKLRIANTGENNPMFGKEVTEETREKIRRHHLGSHRSEETKQKMSISAKIGWKKRRKT